MAEELRLEQAIGNAGAIDRNERRHIPPAAQVNRPGDHLFADTRFSRQQDLGVGARGRVDVGLDALHRVAGPQQRVFLERGA